MVAHLRLLALPFFWDEAGYYIPAARDFFLSGSLIPHSTLHTAHTPLLSLWLALIWKVIGYGVVSTKVAVLAIACFGLWQVYKLADNISNRSVAIATLVLTSCYPILYAQSTLAHSDILATALVWWGLREYFEREPRAWKYAFAFTLAALAKEVVIVVPFALATFELVRLRRQAIDRVAWLCLPATLALIAWFGYQRVATGAFFGDPDYYKYNVSGTISPQRIWLAFAQRAWQALGHMNMWAATLATIAAMFRSAKPNRDRIGIPTQLAFGTIVLATLLFNSVLGGALLTRYLLPIYPLIIVVCVSTWWRRVPYWEWLAGIVAVLFTLACFINPPYRFAPEDNVNYADFVRIHQRAANTIEGRFRNRTVVTAWPATDELSRSELGYVAKPLRPIEIRDFTAAEIAGLREQRFDILLAFSTKYEPPRTVFRSQWWVGMSERFFGYHRDLTPEQIANEISGRVVWQERRNGQWIAIITRELPEDAQLAPPVRFDPADSRMR